MATIPNAIKTPFKTSTPFSDAVYLYTLKVDNFRTQSTGTNLAKPNIVDNYENKLELSWAKLS